MTRRCLKKKSRNVTLVRVRPDQVVGTGTVGVLEIKEAMEQRRRKQPFSRRVNSEWLESGISIWGGRRQLVNVRTIEVAGVSGGELV